MTPPGNRQVLLKARPCGIPQAEHFEIVDAPVGEPGDGQIVVRNHYLSVEPAMRGWVSSVGNYAEPVPIGGVMRAFAVGRIVASRSPAHAVGDIVTGLFGWQAYALVDAASVQRRVADQDLPMSTALGVLGLAGAISDTVLGQLAVGARVVICGTASVASWNPPPSGLRVERHLLVKRARMQGLLIFDYADRYAEGLRALTAWVRAGAIRYREDILDGIEQAPGAIAGLYRGENLGKRLIRLLADLDGRDGSHRRTDP